VCESLLGIAGRSLDFNILSYISDTCVCVCVCVCAYVCVCVCVCASVCESLSGIAGRSIDLDILSYISDMGWLRLVGSLKLYVSLVSLIGLFC